MSNLPDSISMADAYSFLLVTTGENPKCSDSPGSY